MSKPKKTKNSGAEKKPGQQGNVNQFYQRVRATSNVEQIADVNGEATSLHGSDNVDINVVGPTSPASNSRRSSTRSEASEDSRTRR